MAIELIPQQPTKDFGGYSNLFYGRSKLGKSSLVYSLYKQEVFFIFTEKRYQHLVGAYLRYCPNWAAIKKTLRDLDNPTNKSQIKYICIDTVDRAFPMCEEFVLGKFGQEDFGNVEWSKDYSSLKKEWFSVMTKIERMGYIPQFVSHEVTKTEKRLVKDGLTAELEGKEKKKDKKTGAIYVEYETKTPNLKDKYLDILTSMVDNIIHLDLISDDQGERRVAQFRETLLYQAGCTLAYMPNEVSMDAESIKEAFNGALVQELGEDYQLMEDQAEVQLIPFEEVKEALKVIGKRLIDEGKKEKLNKLVIRHLGEGNSVSKATEEQIEQLNTLYDELKSL